MKRALVSRDGGCQFPTCTNRRFVDAHHIEHWAHGGETNLDNLVLLCRKHHRYVHEDGYSIARTDEGVVVRDPAGELVPTSWVLPARHFDGAQRLRAALRARALGITANTNLPRWDGAPPDYDLAVAGLARLT